MSEAPARVHFRPNAWPQGGIRADLGQPERLPYGGSGLSPQTPPPRAAWSLVPTQAGLCPLGPPLAPLVAVTGSGAPRSRGPGAKRGDASEGRRPPRYFVVMMGPLQPGVWARLSPQYQCPGCSAVQSAGSVL